MYGSSNDNSNWQSDENAGVSDHFYHLIGCLYLYLALPLGKLDILIVNRLLSHMKFFCSHALTWFKLNCHQKTLLILFSRIEHSIWGCLRLSARKTVNVWFKLRQIYACAFVTCIFFNCEQQFWRKKIIKLTFQQIITMLESSCFCFCFVSFLTCFVCWGVCVCVCVGGVPTVI